MEIVLMLNTLLIKPEPKKETTAAGIIMPKQGGRGPVEKVWGTVLKAGPGVWTETAQQIPCACLPGDRVLYRDEAAVEVEIGEEKFNIVSEHEVLVVVRGEPVKAVKPTSKELAH